MFKKKHEPDNDAQAKRPDIPYPDSHEPLDDTAFIKLHVTKIHALEARLEKRRKIYSIISWCGAVL